MKRVFARTFLGNSDRTCDFIAESIVFEFLKRDPKSQLNIHVSGSDQMMVISGRAQSTADFDIATVAREAYKKIAPAEEGVEFFATLEQEKDQNSFKKQSLKQKPVVVYGYASSETRELLPYPLLYSLDIERKLRDATINPAYNWLQKDGSVIIETSGKEIEAVYLNIQHKNTVQDHAVKTAMIDILNLGQDENLKLEVNASGPFIKGGLQVSPGSSGRLSSSELYGNSIPASTTSHIGLDPMNPARFGAYMARYIARQAVKNLGVKLALVKMIYTGSNKAPSLVEISTNDGIKKLSDLSLQPEDLTGEKICEKFQLKNSNYPLQEMHHPFLYAGASWED